MFPEFLLVEVWIDGPHDMGGARGLASRFHGSILPSRNASQYDGKLEIYDVDHVHSLGPSLGCLSGGVNDCRTLQEEI